MEALIEGRLIQLQEENAALRSEADRLRCIEKMARKCVDAFHKRPCVYLYSKIAVDNLEEALRGEGK